MEVNLGEDVLGGLTRWKPKKDYEHMMLKMNYCKGTSQDERLYFGNC
jgi:hypothetical protein